MFYTHPKGKIKRMWKSFSHLSGNFAWTNFWQLASIFFSFFLGGGFRHITISYNYNIVQYTMILIDVFRILWQSGKDLFNRCQMLTSREDEGTKRGIMVIYLMLPNDHSILKCWSQGCKYHFHHYATTFHYL